MQEAEQKMQKAVDAVRKEFMTIRTGKANPSILDRVQADFYGTSTPIKNMSNISAIDGRTIGIIPFDKSTLKDIETAIQNADLGLTPNNDGARILIVIPELTRERREELSKLAKKEAEQGKVSIRNIRRDFLDKNKKDDEATEDDKRKYQDDMQKLTDKYIKELDDLTSDKEKEIMTV